MLERFSHPFKKCFILLSNEREISPSMWKHKLIEDFKFQDEPEHPNTKSCLYQLPIYVQHWASRILPIKVNELTVTIKSSIKHL